MCCQFEAKQFHQLTRKNKLETARSIAMKFVQNPTARNRIANPDPMRPTPTIVGAWYRSPKEPEKNDPTSSRTGSLRSEISFSAKVS